MKKNAYPVSVQDTASCTTKDHSQAILHLFGAQNLYNWHALPHRGAGAVPGKAVVAPLWRADEKLASTLHSLRTAECQSDPGTFDIPGLLQQQIGPQHR